MRVVLVGTGRDRVRLKAQLDATMQIVGEFATLAAARAAALDVDAIILAPRNDDQDDRGVGRVRAGVQEPLTPREIEVLELLAEGLPNKGIAGRLGISDQTVKFHIASLSGKLGAANRTDAVRRAVRRGLISL
jgi:ATP/maltotriose-dependent transcriptional regulator MalT